MVLSKSKACINGSCPFLLHKLGEGYRLSRDFLYFLLFLVFVAIPLAKWIIFSTFYGILVYSRDVCICHLKLLSFIQNEINEKKKKAKIFFSFSSHQNRNDIENDKFNQHKDSTNNEQKSDNTLVNSEDDEDDLEESSDMSCDEENIIDI